MKHKVKTGDADDQQLLQINSGIPFILAGLLGHTDGVRILSLSLQQNGDADFRVVLRGEGDGGAGYPVRVVAFSNADTPAECLAVAERGYRSDVIRWHIDRYAKSNSQDATAKNGREGLVIRK